MQIIIIHLVLPTEAVGFFMNGEKSTARRRIGHERTVEQKVHETNKIGQKKKKSAEAQIDNLSCLCMLLWYAQRILLAF
jgi:hypothetical protein